MQTKEEPKTGPPLAQPPGQAAVNGPPPRERWLTRAGKAAGQKVKNAVKDFVDYAKNSEL